ncbi:MAG: hypothetical protein CL840_20270 [Crocinitomicaceae bacterium]|nr:hypothetical protein [Crocinitomicaceae bacterium]|tara:strand:+ start:1097 stop:2353 length:1257 start_codon:yes stop_codon:yes gene_type:complete
MNPYLSNYRFGGRLFNIQPRENTQLIVVIPCFNEPDLIPSLSALLKCEIPSEISVEVIVIINAGTHHSQDIKALSEGTYQKAVTWAEENNSQELRFLIYQNNELPKKHAGVGLARKIGMDEAVDRFSQIDQEEGVIVCFDADSQCDSNYLKAIYTEFKNKPKAPGASIYFEHPLSGNEHDQQVYDGIVWYELFLRYYHQALKFTGHPQAFHTVGSSMAVKAWAYQKQSGMNKRKAGEDFYFLQKIIQLGGFIEINSTRVIPSPRTSDRVPFGTGRSMLEYLGGERLDVSYSFRSFRDVKLFVELVEMEYEGQKRFGTEFKSRLPESICSFLELNDFDDRINDMLLYGTSVETFSKRFFNWFNAFRILKFIHLCRDEYYQNDSLLESCSTFLKEIDFQGMLPADVQMMLKVFRQIDRKP